VHFVTSRRTWMIHLTLYVRSMECVQYLHFFCFVVALLKNLLKNFDRALIRYLKIATNHQLFTISVVIFVSFHSIEDFILCFMHVLDYLIA